MRLLKLSSRGGFAIVAKLVEPQAYGCVPFAVISNYIGCLINAAWALHFSKQCLKQCHARMLVQVVVEKFI